MPDLLPLLREIQDSTRRASAEGRLTHQIGPFLAVAHPTNDMIWLSYALPLAAERNGADIPTAVADLRHWFAQHNRRLRFEILEPLWPDLAPQLVACGVELQGRMPLMLCAPADLRPVPHPPGLTLEPVTSATDDATLATFLQVAHQGFGEPDYTPPPQDLADQREALARNRYRCLLARIDGQPAAVGTMTVGNAELVGVATLPPFRRRGIAAAVSHALTADHFRHGHPMAWLSAGDDAARGCYATIGFRVVGDQINLMDPPPR